MAHYKKCAELRLAFVTLNSLFQATTIIFVIIYMYFRIVIAIITKVLLILSFFSSLNQLCEQITLMNESMAVTFHWSFCECLTVLLFSLSWVFYYIAAFNRYDSCILVRKIIFLILMCSNQYPAFLNFVVYYDGACMCNPFWLMPIYLTV